MSSASEIWLSLDLSSTRGSLALHRWEPEQGVSLLLSRDLGNRMEQTERCYPELEAGFQDVGLTLRDVSRFVTSGGPGSFTGLRVAFSLLKAFALATARPIETVSGSEARALAYLDDHPECDTSFQALEVLTFATARKTVCARFATASPYEWDETEIVLETDQVAAVSSGALVLLDEQIEPAPWMGAHVERFPLQASMLAETLFRAKSRRLYEKSEQLIALSPSYFGSAPLARWQP